MEGGQARPFGLKLPGSTATLAVPGAAGSGGTRSDNVPVACEGVFGRADVTSARNGWQGRTGSCRMRTRKRFPRGMIRKSKGHPSGKLCGAVIAYGTATASPQASALEASSRTKPTLLRPSQCEAFARLRGVRLGILNA